MKKIILALFCLSFGLALAQQHLAHSWIDNIDDNPSLLSIDEGNKGEIRIPSLNVLVENNAFDIDYYNSINGDSLTTKQRTDLLNDMGSKLTLLANLKLTLGGYKYKNYAVKVSSKAKAQFNIDKKYLELILLGNEYNKTYHFTKENTNGQAIAYSNITFATGLGSINKLLRLNSNIPKIYFGLNANILVGHASYEVADFDGVISTDDDNGLNINQTLSLKSSTGGMGFSAGFGFSSNVYKNLMLGFNFKNLAGSINWNSNTEIKEFSANAEKIFVSDIDGDFFNDSDTTYAVSSYSTSIPAEMDFSANYFLEKYKLDFNFNYKQQLAESDFSSNAPEFSLGTKYMPLSWLYIGAETDFANADRNYAVIYDLGFTFKYYEFVIATKAVDAIIPGNSSKGFGINLESKIKF